MATRLIVLFALFVLLIVPLTSAAPDVLPPVAIGTFTTTNTIIVRYTPWHFRFDGVPFTSDNIMPPGQTLPVFGLYYENKTSLVWCYITPALDWFVPCGSVETFYNPANGVLTVMPEHEHTMTVTRPG